MRSSITAGQLFSIKNSATPRGTSFHWIDWTRASSIARNHRSKFYRNPSRTFGAPARTRKRSNFLQRRF